MKEDCRLTCRHLKSFLKTTANPPPLFPDERGELMWEQSGGSSSLKAADSPVLSQVSVTHRKSSPCVVKKSRRMKVLLTRDLALTRPNLAETGTSEAAADSGGARHSGRRWREITPRRRRRGEKKRGGEASPSKTPQTGIIQGATGSSERGWRKKPGRDPLFLREETESRARRALTFTS